jgi:hypothetical protein
LIFDTASLELVGMIDPLDACWGDADLDLVHLTKSGGQRLQLVEAYRSGAAEDPRDFALRYWCYMFWAWMAVVVEFQSDDDPWFVTCAQRLEAALRERG